jgi:hypothetical protein
MEINKHMNNGENNIEYVKTEPILTPIKNGWAARGLGWAVHGRSKEEAVEKYYEAEARHREIDQRPFWFERHRQEGFQDEKG